MKPEPLRPDPVGERERVARVELLAPHGLPHGALGDARERGDPRVADAPAPAGRLVHGVYLDEAAAFQSRISIWSTSQAVLPDV